MNSPRVTGISLFDLVLLSMASYGLVFFLGVYAGRAAAWREGCWFIAGVDPLDVGPPPKPEKEKPTPPHVHSERRGPPEVEKAAMVGNGRETKVVSRRREGAGEHGRNGRQREDG